MTSISALDATPVIRQQDLTQNLALEVDDLDDLKDGLLRHLDAFHAAHAAATARLSDVLQRMDSILERIDRKGA